MVRVAVQMDCLGRPSLLVSVDIGHSPAFFDVAPLITRVSPLSYLPSLFPLLCSHFQGLEEILRSGGDIFMSRQGSTAPLPWHYPAGVLFAGDAPVWNVELWLPDPKATAPSPSASAAGADAAQPAPTSAAAPSALPLFKQPVLKATYLSQLKESCQCLFGTTSPIMTMSTADVDTLAGAVLDGPLVDMERFAKIRNSLFSRDLAGCLLRIHDATLTSCHLRRLQKGEMNKHLRELLGLRENETVHVWGTILSPTLLDAVTADDLLSQASGTDLAVHVALCSTQQP